MGQGLSWATGSRWSEDSCFPLLCRTQPANGHFFAFHYSKLLKHDHVEAWSLEVSLPGVRERFPRVRETWSPFRHLLIKFSSPKDNWWVMHNNYCRFLLENRTDRGGVEQRVTVCDRWKAAGPGRLLKAFRAGVSDAGNEQDGLVSHVMVRAAAQKQCRPGRKWPQSSPKANSKF